MTVAVCLQCGEFKHGAFNPCLKCGYKPDNDESLTKHLLVTDHFQSRESLENVAARVKAGVPIEFEPELLRDAWVSKAELDTESERIRRGCFIGLGFFALMIAVAVYLASRH